MKKYLSKRKHVANRIPIYEVVLTTNLTFDIWGCVDSLSIQSKRVLSIQGWKAQVCVMDDRELKWRLPLVVWNRSSSPTIAKLRWESTSKLFNPTLLN